jgi:hypothetical protein
MFDIHPRSREQVGVETVAGLRPTSLLRPKPLLAIEPPRPDQSKCGTSQRSYHRIPGAHSLEITPMRISGPGGEPNA